MSVSYNGATHATIYFNIEETISIREATTKIFTESAPRPIQSTNYGSTDHQEVSSEPLSVTQTTTVFCMEMLVKYQNISLEHMNNTLQILLWEPCWQINSHFYSHFK